MRARAMKAGRAFTTLPLLCALSVILLLNCTSVSAQDQKAPDRGFTPGGSYALGDIETINTTNGNLMLNIPLAALPPGRGGIAAKISLFYNSKLYDPRTIYRDCSRTPYGAPIAPEEPAGPQCSGDSVMRAVIVGRNNEVGGWRYGYKYKIDLEGRNYYPPTTTIGSYNPCLDSDYLYYFKLFVTFPDGSRHEFRLLDRDDRDGYYKYRPDGSTNGWNPSTNSGYCPSEAALNTKMVYYSVDSTYTRLEFEQDGDHNDWSNNPWTLSFPDGTRVTGGNAPQRITDRNGNYIEIQEHVPYNSNYADKIVDQLGRSIAIEHDGATGDDRIHQSGTGNADIITTVKWKSIQVSKTYNAGGGSTTTPLNPTFHVIDQIVLPEQAGSLSYSFGYNAGTASSSGWGELSSVTMPSGASTAYSYKLDGQAGSTITAMDVINNSPTQKVLNYRLEYDGVPQSNAPCAQGSPNCATETWTYSFPDPDEGGTTTITGPEGGVTSETFYGGTGHVYKVLRPGGTVIERQWTNNVAYTAGTAVQELNSYFKAEMTSITDAQGALVKTSVKDYQYDKNGNLLRVRESDWQSYSSLHDGSGNAVWANVSSVQFVRTTLNTYYLDAPEASESSATDPRNANVYNRDTAPRLLNSLKASEIRSGSETGSVASRNEFFYNNSLTTGNLTEQKSWDSTKGAYSNPLSQANSISVTQQYDSYGNIILKTDARGTQTKYTYGAVNGITGLYPTRIEVAYGTTLKCTSTQEYDFSTGAVTKTTDVDNNVSTSTQYDVFSRPVLVKVAVGTTLETRTSMEYSDTARRVITRSDLNTTGDGKLVGIKHYDQLGRIRLVQQLEDASTESETDETKGIKVQTRYMFSGSNSYQLMSNPYRTDYATATTSDPTVGWTRTKNNQGGQVVEVQTFAGSSLPAPWGANANTTGTVKTLYDGVYTTVTDQAEKSRKSETDALGRLIKVFESPQTLNYETSYTYDVLGNLLGVTQNTAQATQTRTFVYSSLSRLMSVENPESGKIDYQYDATGNLVLKIDPRASGGNLPNCSIPYTGTHIATCYEYDALNRLTTRKYNDGTPEVAYTYDTLANGKGRLTSVSSSVSTTSYTGYDSLGRVTGSTQVTDGHTYSMPEYKYDLAGHLTSQQYPSGRIVTTSYDAAGRTSTVTGQKSGEPNKPYASSYEYTAASAIKAFKLGNQLWGRIAYNSRLQLTELKLGSSSMDTDAASADKLKLSYSYGTTDDNGNVQSQTISSPAIGSAPAFNCTQSYTYDALNRLETFTETGGLNQIYEYDRWGNRAVTGNYTDPDALILPQTSINDFKNNNRIKTYDDNGWYDAAGNLRQLPGHAYVYDAENHMTLHDDFTTAGVTEDDRYAYDGSGQRVKKVNRSVTTIYVYDAMGRMVAEYTDDSRTSPTNGTSYLTADHLGTPRIITNQQQGVVSRHDYLPFGEEIKAGTGGRTEGQGYIGKGDGVRQKFTQYERDNETGLDYAQARYYASAQGRFTSADPLMASAHNINPQTWNRYSYAFNKPTISADPSGLDPQQQDERSFSGLACNPRLDSNCGPAFNFSVDVQGDIPQVPTSDAQVVSDLQINTGVARPIPQDTLTVQLLDGLFSQSGSGAAVMGSTVAVRRPDVALDAFFGAVLATMAIDAIKTGGEGISDTLPAPPPELGNRRPLALGLYPQVALLAAATGSELYSQAAGISTFSPTEFLRVATAAPSINFTLEGFSEQAFQNWYNNNRNQLDLIPPNNITNYEYYIVRTTPALNAKTTWYPAGTNLPKIP